MHAQQLLLGGRRRLDAAPSRASRGCPARPRSRGCGRRAPGGRTRCRARATSRGGRTAACAPVPYRARERLGRLHHAPTSRSSGPAPPASTPPSWRPREGASVALVSRSPLAQTASYWAQGGIAAALADDDSPELHAADTIAAGRDAARASAVRVLCEESPARVRDLQELGVQFDADRERQPRARPRGRPLAAARRARRRRGHRPADHARRCRRSPPRTSASAVLEPRRGQRARHGRGPLRRARAAPARGRPVRAVGASGDPRHRRDGRAVAAHHQPARRDRRGAQPRRARRARSSPTSSSCSSTPRRCGWRARATASSSPRRCAARARACTTREGERFVDELAPRDEVALAIQTELDADGRAGRLARHAARGGGALPEHRRGARGRGPRPGARPDPGRARGALHDGRRGHGPRRALDAARACTRWARRACTGLHGANRLASNSLAECFVFGAPRGAGRVPRARRRPSGRRPRRTRAQSPIRRPRRPARRCGATPGCGATPTAWPHAQDDPYPARAPDRRVLPRARGEPRRPPAHRPSRHRARRSTTCTRSSQATASRPSSGGTRRPRRLGRPTPITFSRRDSAL